LRSHNKTNCGRVVMPCILWTLSHLPAASRVRSVLISVYVFGGV
jgi:hypothetical protein